MEYKEFLLCLKDKLELLCNEGESVQFETIVKNNSVKLDAIILKKEGDLAFPTIYVRDYYSESADESVVEEIARGILEFGRINRLDIDFDINEFCDFEKMKSSIAFKLINSAKNEELLKAVPHRDFNDLSIVYYCVMDTYVGGSAATIIYNKHTDIWKCTEEELYELAKINTERLNKPVLRSINDIILELVDRGEFDSDTADDLYEDLKDESVCPMYVLTNERKTYGASCLLYENILENFAEEHGDFYILPSSIHELILVPDEGNSSPTEFLNMVKNVNESQVADEEILSDNVYRYSSYDGLIHTFSNITFDAERVF